MNAAYLSRRLATILTDLQVTLDLEAARIDLLEQMPEVEAFFREMEFRTLTTRLRNHDGAAHRAGSAAGPAASESPAAIAPAGSSHSLAKRLTRIGISPSYQLEVRMVDTPASPARPGPGLDRAERISFDTETTSTDPLRAETGGHFTGRPGRQRLLHPGRPHDRRNPTSPRAGHRRPAPADDRPAQGQSRPEPQI